MRRLGLWHTVRGRLLLLAIGVELLMLSVMVANSARLLYSAMTQQTVWHAHQIAPVLNAALTAPLAQRDLATVQAVLDESRSTDDLLYLLVVDRQGMLVASSGVVADKVQKLTNSEGFRLRQHPELSRYDVTVPIMQSGQQLGVLHFGLDLTRIFHARRLLLTQGVGIAAVELVLSSLVLLLIGFWLTRHLGALTKASLEVAAGNLTPSAVPEGPDDIGQLGTAFNTMSRVISERIQELEELNRTLEQRVQEEVGKNREKDAFMLQQDKLASIGQLAAGVAHEINNPMGFIMSNLSTLKEYGDALTSYHRALDEQQQRGTGESSGCQELAQKLDIPYILEDMEPLIVESLEGAERVKRIVQDLKDFARIDENRFVDGDLNQLIQSTINIVRNEIKYVADLELHLGEVPQIRCIPQQINQVITNLLVNAAQAMDTRGRITITTRQEGDKVLLEVRDTGCGMTEEVRVKIFEPFFTTKDVGKGTGLGLAICYDIIQKHQGEIEVESKPGTGTVFKVWLPVV